MLIMFVNAYVCVFTFTNVCVCTLVCVYARTHMHTRARTNTRTLRHAVDFAQGLGTNGLQDEFFGAKFPPLARPLIRRLLALDPAQRLDLAAAVAGGDGGGGGEGLGEWGSVKADEFFGGIDFGALATLTPPDFSSGIVSADAASVFVKRGLY